MDAGALSCPRSWGNEGDTHAEGLELLEELRIRIELGWKPKGRNYLNIA